MAAAFVGCVAAYAIHAHFQAQPVAVNAPSPPRPAPAAEDDPAKLFGALIVEPEWREMIAGKPTAPGPLASLGPEPPAPPPPPVAAQPAPQSAPAVANALPDAVPLPPIRDVPSVEDNAPLPPARPSEFAEPQPIPAAPDRRVAQPSPGPVAPADNRNIFQRLLGIGPQPGAVVASRPPAPAPAVAPAPSRPAAEPAPETTVVARPASAGQNRGAFSNPFAFFSPANPTLDRLGYDRQTAVYDISARTVYMPDGSKLEAHSGLGAALDDVRYVGERAVGPTPPHLYELTLRESLFHGVQAIRLTPVGDGGVYGRAGLLAHSYMLGPNGDSNGCVSFRDYEAFLRAYQNGQVRKLAVVSRL